METWYCLPIKGGGALAVEGFCLLFKGGGPLAVEGCIPQSPLATAPFKGSQDSVTHSSWRANPSVGCRRQLPLTREPYAYPTFIRATRNGQDRSLRTHRTVTGKFLIHGAACGDNIYLHSSL